MAIFIGVFSAGAATLPQQNITVVRHLQISQVFSKHKLYVL
jgi:hypothetical protein